MSEDEANRIRARLDRLESDGKQLDSGTGCGFVSIVFIAFVMANYAFWNVLKWQPIIEALKQTTEAKP